MKKSPLVSCIIIFFNAKREKFFEEAIESILSQSYQNLELLLVDDGSTDYSTQVARQYVMKYPEKITYLEHENHQNLGMSASRNLGIKHSKGDFIAFLDADDIWTPNKLDQQLEIFETHPEAGMVYGRTLLWYSWSGSAKNSEKDHFYSLGVPPNSLIHPPQLLIKLLQGHYQTPATCNAILRKEVFDQVGCFEEPFRGMYEDRVFFTKVLLHVPTFVSSSFWAKYRQHPKSCCNATAQDLEKAYTARLFYLDWLKNYLRQQSVKHPYIRFLFLKETILYCNPCLIYYWNSTKSYLMELGRSILPTFARNILWLMIGRHI